jgi:copper ion binding protein
MPRLELQSPDTTTGRAHDLLAQLWERHDGAVGPMVRAMAGSPAVLGGYLELSRAMKRSKLRRELSERVSLVVQDQLGCATCLAAHTAAARAAGISDDEIARARQATSADPAVAALLAFARQVHLAPSSIDDGLRRRPPARLPRPRADRRRRARGPQRLDRLLQPRRRHRAGGLTTTPMEENPMSTTATYTVSGMTCGHCVASVREEVGKVDGVTGVDVELATGTVTVESERPVDSAEVAAAVEEAGYEVTAS